MSRAPSWELVLGDTVIVVVRVVAGAAPAEPARWGLGAAAAGGDAPAGGDAGEGDADGDWLADALVGSC